MERDMGEDVLGAVLKEWVGGGCVSGSWVYRRERRYK
jgi:hypothetical protein